MALPSADHDFLLSAAHDRLTTAPRPTPFHDHDHCRSRRRPIPLWTFTHDPHRARFQRRLLSPTRAFHDNLSPHSRTVTEYLRDPLERRTMRSDGRVDLIVPRPPVPPVRVADGSAPLSSSRARARGRPRVPPLTDKRQTPARPAWWLPAARRWAGDIRRQAVLCGVWYIVWVH